MTNKKTIYEKIKNNHLWPNWFININDLVLWWVEIVKLINSSNKKLNVVIYNLNQWNQFKKLLKNIDIFLKTSNINDLETSENINYILDINYTKQDLDYIKENISNIKVWNSNLYLSIDKFNNQDDVNKSYFLEIFNVFKNSKFVVNTDYIRYESAYKNLYIIWPRELTFDISEYCNANCIFCYTNGPWFLSNRWINEENENKYKQKTNLDNLVSFVKEAWEVGIELLTLWITWDPFISTDLIWPILKILPETNLKVWFLTNWYGLIENIDDIINCKNIESFYINISAWNLDSFTKTRIWDKFSDFINTWKAIKIIKTNRPDIKIKALFIVTPLNYEWINNFIELCEKNLVDEIELKEVVNYWFEEKMTFSDTDIENIINYLAIIKETFIKNNYNDFIELFNRKKDKNIDKTEIYNKLPEKCYNQYLYNAIVRDKIYTCCKFIVSPWEVLNWKLGTFYKTIENNNKIFKVTENIEEVVWEKKYKENCSRCFHLHNLIEIEDYINKKNTLFNI